MKTLCAQAGTWQKITARLPSELQAFVTDSALRSNLLTEETLTFTDDESLKILAIARELGLIEDLFFR